MSSPDRSTLSCPGAEIFYVTYPSPFAGAPDLVLLHGNGEDHTYFSQQIAALSPHFRLVLMDTRGQGRSSGIEGPLDFSTFAGDLLRLLDHLHICRAHLLGFSDGGNLALTFALQYPQRVRSLILNGANLYPSGMCLPVLLSTAAEYAATLLLSPFWVKARHRASLLGLMVHHPHIAPKALSSLTVPALVLVGQHDMIRYSHSRLIASSLPNARFVCMPGADHFCAAKQPDAFNRIVLDFLQHLSA